MLCLGLQRGRRWHQVGVWVGSALYFLGGLSHVFQGDHTGFVLGGGQCIVWRRVRHWYIVKIASNSFPSVLTYTAPVVDSTFPLLNCIPAMTFRSCPKPVSQEHHKSCCPKFFSQPPVNLLETVVPLI